MTNLSRNRPFSPEPGVRLAEGLPMPPVRPAAHRRSVRSIRLPGQGLRRGRCRRAALPCACVRLHPTVPVSIDERPRGASTPHLRRSNSPSDNIHNFTYFHLSSAGLHLSVPRDTVFESIDPPDTGPLDSGGFQKSLRERAARPSASADPYRYLVVNVI
ncbi:hypothetical protein J6590_045388 [Homalodisca vitripennis]|nr:hypothetical protein J6590_045388 [Homalodisca vitripennis]